MTFFKKNGYLFLLIGIFGDFIMPYFLGFFYPDLNQFVSVMSLFGEVGSPVRSAFFIWSVITGIFYVLSLPAVYSTIRKTSEKLAVLATIAIAAYGIGDCIFTGLFSVNSSGEDWNLSAWIHNVGSALGYTGILLFPLILIIFFKKQKNNKKKNSYIIFLFLSLVIAIIYGLTRIPQLNQYVIFQQIGFWQRLSFAFNYLPIIYFSVEQLKTKSYL